MWRSGLKKKEADSLHGGQLGSVRFGMHVLAGGLESAAMGVRDIIYRRGGCGWDW